MTPINNIFTVKQTICFNREILTEIKLIRISKANKDREKEGMTTICSMSRILVFQSKILLRCS